MKNKDIYRILIFAIIVFSSLSIQGQETKKLYDPSLDGSGYSIKKVTGFFRQWTPVALVPRLSKPAPAKK